MTNAKNTENYYAGSLKAVSSDCKPWLAGLNLCVLDGVVSQERTKEWFENIDEIYRTYEIYAQAGGTEQAVFVAGNGAGETRSSRLVECLSEFLGRKALGRALDVGCGNGSFLREFNRVFPEWNLEGSEYAEINRERVLGSPKVEAFHTCELSGLEKGRYSLVSMIHLLEHIPEPRAFLEQASELLTEDGLLFIQVPGFLENPFELLIYDHASHFTPASLRQLLEASGFEVSSISVEWVKKEISVVAKRKTTTSELVVEEGGQPEEGELQAAISWLESFRDRMKTFAETSKEQPWVFGSSIAASWAYSELEGNVAGFIDEDRSRIGRSHLGKPIIGPSSIPLGNPVIVPIAPVVADKIRAKFSGRSEGWMF